MSSATLFLRNVAYIGYLKHICHCHQKLYLKSSSHFLFENITYVGSLKYFVFLHVFMMTYKQIYGHWTSRISTFILDPAPVCWRCAGVLWHQRVRDEQRGLRWELGLCQHRWKLLLWTMHFRLLVIKYDLIWPHCKFEVAFQDSWETRTLDARTGRVFGECWESLKNSKSMSLANWKIIIPQQNTE